MEESKVDLYIYIGIKKEKRGKERGWGRIGFYNQKRKK